MSETTSWLMESYISRYWCANAPSRERLHKALNPTMTPWAQPVRADHSRGALRASREDPRPGGAGSEVAEDESSARPVDHLLSVGTPLSMTRAGVVHCSAHQPSYRCCLAVGFPPPACEARERVSDSVDCASTAWWSCTPTRVRFGPSRDYDWMAHLETWAQSYKIRNDRRSRP